MNGGGLRPHRDVRTVHPCATVRCRIASRCACPGVTPSMPVSSITSITAGPHARGALASGPVRRPTTRTPSGQRRQRHRWFLLLICALSGVPGGAGSAAAATESLVQDLTRALATFRTEAPRGWSFIQTTKSGANSTVERCDTAKPEFNRWTLVQKDGQAPTEDEKREYAALRSRRSRRGTAPKLADQLDLTTLELIAQTGDRATVRCRMKPAEPGDTVANFLSATITWHTPTRTIERVVLASAGEFSPALGVRIRDMRTVMTYHLPENGQPSLPASVSTRVRGRAFWFKSLDAERSVTFTEYAWAGRR